MTFLQKSNFASRVHLFSWSKGDMFGLSDCKYVVKIGKIGCNQIEIKY
eukprot:UN01100